MTREPEGRSDAWWTGFHKGIADRETGALTLICGGSQAALDEAAGYAAGRGEWWKEARQHRQAAREAEAG